VPLRRVTLSDERRDRAGFPRASGHHGQALSFSASSVWGVSTRFRLEIGMITRREQSFGTPQPEKAGAGMAGGMGDMSGMM
jgi:hypothetical protein